MGSTPLKQLITVAPAGIEAYFALCAEEYAKPHGPDRERLLTISQEHDIHLQLA